MRGKWIRILVEGQRNIAEWSFLQDKEAPSIMFCKHLCPRTSFHGDFI